MREGQSKVLNEREFNRVINAIKKKSHVKRNTALLYCSFGLGLRAKEMAGQVSRIEYEPTDDLKLMACREVQYYFSYWEDPDAMERPPFEQADDDEDY